MVFTTVRHAAANQTLMHHKLPLFSGIVFLNILMHFSLNWHTLWLIASTWKSRGHSSQLDGRRLYSMPAKINTKCCNLATYLHSNYFQSSRSRSRPKNKVNCPPERWQRWLLRWWWWPLRKHLIVVFAKWMANGPQRQQQQHTTQIAVCSLRQWVRVRARILGLGRTQSSQLAESGAH